MTRSLRCVALALLLVGGLSSSGLAQPEVLFSQLQFNFITPGARATALGGAFIGSAGDATAVESNPAGLTQLTEPEVSIEFKHLAYQEEHLYENYTFGGNQSICGDVITKDFKDFVETIPFVSAVFPFTWKETKLVFALYRQELVNYQTAFRTSPYPIGYPGQRYWDSYMLPMDAALDLNITNYGIGLAVQFPFLEGLSFAVSPRWSEMKIKAHTTWYCHNPRFDEGVFPENPHEAATDFSDGDILTDERIDDRDSSFSVNIGFLWELHPGVSFGAVYRSGPKFNVPRVFKVRGKERWGVSTRNFSVNIPDAFGAGIKFVAHKNVILTVDVIQIQYKDLFKGELYLGGPGGYTINNGSEVHVGIEYLLSLAERPLALRVGGYYEPDHAVKYEGEGPSRFYYLGGKDQIHVTGGVGLVVNKHFKVDTAVDIAGIRKQASVSVVYTF